MSYIWNRRNNFEKIYCDGWNTPCFNMPANWIRMFVLIKNSFVIVYRYNFYTAEWPAQLDPRNWTSWNSLLDFVHKIQPYWICRNWSFSRHLSRNWVAKFQPVNLTSDQSKFHWIFTAIFTWFSQKCVMKVKVQMVNASK